MSTIDGLERSKYTKCADGCKVADAWNEREEPAHGVRDEISAHHHIHTQEERRRSRECSSVSADKLAGG